jgi:MFS family permease
MSPEQQPSPIRGISRNVFLLGIVSLFNDISSEMLYPLIPLFLTATLGAPVAIVGVIEGAAEMTASVLKAFSGWMSDRLGRRLPFVIGGYGLSAVAKPALALAGGWPLVLVARVADRFGKGMRGTARDAIIAESSDPAQRGRAFGFHRSADQVGAVAGPLLALPLLAFFHQNYRAVFIAAFIPGALGVLLLFLVKETGRGAKAAAELPKFRWSETTPAFRRFLFITLLFALGNSSDVFLILRARQLGISASAVMVLYAFFNLIVVLTSFPAGVLSDRLGRKRILVAGFALFAVVYAGFGLASNIAAIWIFYGLYGLHMGMTEGVSRAFAVDLVSPDHRGTALGLHSLATGATTLAASSVAGLLWNCAGAPAAFYYGAATATLSALLLMTMVSKPTSSQPGLKGESADLLT